MHGQNAAEASSSDSEAEKTGTSHEVSSLGLTHRPKLTNTEVKIACLVSSGGFPPMTAGDDESEAQSSEEESSDDESSGQEAPVGEGGTRKSSMLSDVSLAFIAEPDRPSPTNLYPNSLSPYAEELEDSLPAHRLEDLSEDDFDGGAASDDSDVARMQEKLAEQKRCCPDSSERAMANPCAPLQQ